MDYRFLSPHDAYVARKELIGKQACRAYWLTPDTLEGAQNTPMYYFAFKVIKGIHPGPHAFTLIFEDDSREELITYDTICVL